MDIDPWSRKAQKERRDVWSLATPEQRVDQWWRLNNLYWIQVKGGGKVLFRAWPHQEEIYRNRHKKNIVLKGRQAGMTTLIQLLFLDECLFNPNISAGVIAHTNDAAADFFRRKIKFAYDNLPLFLKQAMDTVSSNKNELLLTNGSSIKVGTSHRSGTLQFLHISEYGAMCARNPDRAQEVRTGALNAIASGENTETEAWIESTAMGRAGHFYKLCEGAMVMADRDVRLTDMDWRMHFVPWYVVEDYRLAGHFSISDEFLTYFERFELETGVHIDQEQRNWYVKKAEDMGDEMKPEYPGTWEEAFEKILRGAIFAPNIAKVRRDGRITRLPVERGIPVNVFWDLGYSDYTSLWFHQAVGAWDHFVRYFEDSLADLSYYINRLDEIAKEHGYRFGTMYLPHDGKARHVEAIAGTAEDILRQHGFRVRVVNRTLQKINSIEATRRRFDSCRFDEAGCADGIMHLEAYQWAYNERMDCFNKSPLHNAASHGADAFQTFGWWKKIGGDGQWGQQYGDKTGDSTYFNRPRGNRAPENRLHARNDGQRYGHLL